MLRPVGVAPNMNVVRPAPQRPQNEEKEGHRPGAVQPTIVVNVPRRAGSEEEKQAMKRGGKVKAKPKKKVGKKAVAKKKAPRKAPAKKPITGFAEKSAIFTQPAFNMFGYRLAPTMPIMGGSVAPTPAPEPAKYFAIPISRTDPTTGEKYIEIGTNAPKGTELEKRLKESAMQRYEAEKQKKQMEEVNNKRQPTGQSAVSMVMPSPASPQESEEEEEEEDNMARAVLPPKPPVAKKSSKQSPRQKRGSKAK
jgi:hypothetical protein